MLLIRKTVLQIFLLLRAVIIPKIQKRYIRACFSKEEERADTPPEMPAACFTPSPAFSGVCEKLSVSTFLDNTKVGIKTVKSFSAHFHAYYFNNGCFQQGHLPLFFPQLLLSSLLTVSVFWSTATPFVQLFLLKSTVFHDFCLMYTYKCIISASYCFFFLLYISFSAIAVRRGRRKNLV